MFDAVLLALIGAGLLAIIALIALIVKSLAEGGSGELEAAQSFREAGGDAGAFKDAGGEAAPAGQRKTAAKPKKKESEPQRLARVERELAEREARVKEQKMAELEEREHVIRMREEQEKMQPAVPDAPPVPSAELERERDRIRALMDKAQDRYAAGELEEANFKRIMSDYQQQVLDIDVKLRKARNL